MLCYAMLCHAAALLCYAVRCCSPQTIRPAAELDPCANYLPKLKKRFEAHRHTYTNLCAEAGGMFDHLSRELAAFASEGRYQLVNVVHGDPVFSNVLLTNDPRIVLLDMRGERTCRRTRCPLLLPASLLVATSLLHASSPPRAGELGATLTLQGDLHYDLSKVYQSLLGYDFIILGQQVLEHRA